MNYRQSIGDRIIQVLIYLILSCMCVMMLYPFLHVLSISMSTPAEASRLGIHLYPKEVSLDAYRNAFNSNGIEIGFFNSIYRTVIGSFLAVLIMSFGAYALSKKYLPHRKFYTMLIVFTMFFQGGLLPTYFLIKGLGLYDTRLVLIVPCLINTFQLLLIRNFFMGLPEEIEESAKMDGANDIVILFRLILPLSMPILATVFLMQASAHWNAWFDALIYTTSRKNMVLQIFLRKLVVDGEDSEMNKLLDMAGSKPTPETVKAAVVMIVTFPILLVYPFLQKYFVKGIMVGSVKG